MESFTKSLGDKAEQYKNLLSQAAALLQHEQNIIANTANLCAMIKEQFNWLWIGFYFVDQEKNNLVLGPFQGPLACTRISMGKGVCGTAWSSASIQVVPNVNEFPGHIACSSLSQSEIVIPCFDKNKNVVAVLDIDSEFCNNFDAVDAHYLKEICALLSWN